MSLAMHILITVAIVVVMLICLYNVVNDTKEQSINEELAEIKPLLSEDMYRRVSYDVRHGHGVFAKCVSPREKPLSIKDVVLWPIIYLCGIAFWVSIISIVFDLSLGDFLVAVGVFAFFGFFGLAAFADCILI